MVSGTTETYALKGNIMIYHGMTWVPNIFQQTSIRAKHTLATWQFLVVAKGLMTEAEHLCRSCHLR